MQLHSRAPTLIKACQDCRGPRIGAQKAQIRPALRIQATGSSQRSGVESSAKQKERGDPLQDAQQDSASSRTTEATTSGKSEESGEYEVSLALKALHWYKDTVSPILPNSCRFLPTCSSYSVQAYKEFGNIKGTVLTAWRLMRCSPLNFHIKFQGKYDPPSWPPVGLEWAFRDT